MYVWSHVLPLMCRYCLWDLMSHCHTLSLLLGNSFHLLLLFPALSSLMNLPFFKFPYQKLLASHSLLSLLFPPSFICVLFHFTIPFSHSLCLSPFQRVKTLQRFSPLSHYWFTTRLTKINKSPIGSKRRLEDEREEDWGGDERETRKDRQRGKSSGERHISDKR